MTVMGVVVVADGRGRLDLDGEAGKYLRRLCRMAYGIHLHAPMRGCHVSVARAASPRLRALAGARLSVSLTLGVWFTNGNAVWTPVRCDALAGLWDVWAEPHLCIGYLTQEATRFG